jgi:NTP pyrophosphatase (non-canonical NTP hydrolase)
VTDLAMLRDQLRAFAAERDWDRFHAPKNLAMALTVEAAELLEIFQWLGEDESNALDAKAHAAASDEIADVLLYLVRLGDRLGIDPMAAAQRKLAANAARYPVDKARGSRRKHDEL